MCLCGPRVETDPYIIDIGTNGKWGYYRQFDKSYSGKCAAIWGLLKTNLASNLIGFGVDNVSIFQGTKITITIQLRKKHAPSCLGFAVLPIIQIL